MILSRRRIAAFAVLIALVLAQTGAQLHAYAHLRSAVGESGAGSVPSRVCGDCLSFAPLLSATSAPAGLLVPSAPGADELPLLLVASPAAIVRCHPYRSRAPPRLV